MSGFTNPWENEFLGEYYSKFFLETEPKLKRRSQRHYARKALLELGLAEKQEGNSAYRLPLLKLVKQAFKIMGIKATEENLAEQEQRLAILRLSGESSEKVLRISKNLFGNTTLNSVVKTICLASRDYTFVPATPQQVKKLVIKDIEAMRLPENKLTKKRRVFLENKLEQLKQTMLKE